MAEQSIIHLTAWLRDQPDLVAARIVYLMREKGFDVKNAVCAKVFPDTINPTGGIVINPQGTVYQFVFNRSGMIMELSDIEEWTNITATYMDHPSRDEILAGLRAVEQGL